MRRLFKFRYPKLLLLVIVIILSYIIFSNPQVSNFIYRLGNLKYLGIFIAGMFLALGFTSPFSVGFFIISNPENIFLAAIIAGLGAMTSDLLIFKLIHFSFADEFFRLERTHYAKKLSEVIEKDLGKKIKNYLIYALVGIFIASPLPDEIGMIMMAGLTKIKPIILAITAFILHTLGILFLLYI